MVPRVNPGASQHVISSRVQGLENMRAQLFRPKNVKLDANLAYKIGLQEQLQEWQHMYEQLHLRAWPFCSQIRQQSCDSRPSDIQAEDNFFPEEHSIPLDCMYT